MKPNVFLIMKFIPCILEKVDCQLTTLVVKHHEKKNSTAQREKMTAATVCFSLYIHVAHCTTNQNMFKNSLAHFWSFRRTSLLHPPLAIKSESFVAKEK